MSVTNCFKIIAAILLANTLNGYDVIWQKSHGDDAFIDSAKPLLAIERQISDDINHYLQMRPPIGVDGAIAPFVQLPAMPQMPQKPKEPRALELVQGTFESTQAFRARVEASKKRLQKEYLKELKRYEAQKRAYNEQIEALQEEYLEAVASRNASIEELEEVVKEDIAYLTRRYSQKVAQLPKYLNRFANRAFSRYLGSPRLHFLSYNADTEIMQLKITSDYNGYGRLLEITIAPDEAKEMYNNINSVEAKVHFMIDLNQEKRQFIMRYNYCEIAYDGEAYKSKVAKKVVRLQPKVALLSPDSTKAQEALAKVASFKQSKQYRFNRPSFTPITPKKYRVSYAKNDPILERLEGIKGVKKDASKWLVVIGIEHYRYSDAIAYANNSAKAFYKVFQKRYGVLDANTFLLLDDEASAGRILDTLKELRRYVKSGDTIYFYYNGHGVANPKEDNRAYILPSDAMVEYISEQKSFALENIYKALLQTQAKKVFAFVDTCFSGAVDNRSIYKGVASARIVAKEASVSTKRLSVITAGRGREFSNKYEEMGHRLMSYYLLEAILEGKQNIFTIYRRLYKGVFETSRQMGPVYTQQPQLYGNKEATLWDTFL